ncbi:MAG: recombination protein RecA [Kosmotogales bacterium]|nr:recombination protein RecA [Kosmotogales bacterium]
MIDENKKKVLDKAISSIEKQHGKGSIMYLGEKKASSNVEVIPTGSISLDVALTVGGYPRGRIVEIYGAESSGKTTLALHAIASAQKRGGVVAFIDAEHALDISYAEALGVDLDSLLISQPDFGEQALDIVETLVRSNAIDLIVIDSVAALVPKTEIEGSMGELQIGLQARLMSQALRKISGAVSKSRTTIIFINQIRMKIGIAYGSPTTTTGGIALKFYSSIRLEIKKSGVIRDGNDLVGNETKIKVVKNKVAPPFKEVQVDLIYGKGFARENELFNLALENEMIERKGAWYSYIDENGEEISLGQGKNNSIDYLVSNEELLDKIEKRIKIMYKILKDQDTNENEESES